MKRVLLLLLATVLVVSLSACGKHSELICDSCGVSFIADADYTEQLKEDAEIQEALGIDLYSFFCSDCRNEYAGSAMAVNFLTTEDFERLEAYRAGEAIQSSNDINDNVTIVESTGMDSYYIAMDDLSGLYGVYDISERDWKADPVFSAINPYDSEGMALAQKNGFYGFINSVGETIVGFQFAEADPFINGLARVCMNKWGVIDTTGTFIVDPMYEEISILDNSYISIYNGERYGLCDSSGAIIVEMKYLDGFKFTSSRIYACKRMDSYGPWYEILDYEGNSLMDTIPVGNTLYVSYPDNGVHIVCFNYQEVDENFYCVYDENFNAIFSEACGYVSDFSSFGYAVVIPVPSATRTWSGSWELEEEGQFVIDKEGNRICQLPVLPSYDTRYSRGGGEWLYKYSYYVNQYYAMAMDSSGSGYLINLQSLEYSEWESVKPIENSNYVAVQDKSTELWSFYDGTNLVDSNCTKIEYSGTGTETQFKLYHGGECTEYPS